jgi:transcriptional regulator with XRE-family HTH domain
MQPQELRQWREQLGCTQAEVAERFFNVTSATVRNWESGATPIPAAVDRACEVWGRRIRQESPGYGPVILFWNDGPMFRSPYRPQRMAMMQQQQYAMNGQAIAQVCEMWGRDDFQNPFIVERGGKTLWNIAELARVVDGSDEGAPTRRNLLKRCADTIKALAEDARTNVDLTVWNRGEPTPEQKRDRRERILQISAELDQMAPAAEQGSVTQLEVEEQLNELRLRLGKRPSDTLVNAIAKAFVGLDALPTPGRRSR